MKETLFLIRGLTREARHWGQFREILDSNSSEIKIETIEIPGAGVHHKVPSHLTIKEMVSFMRNEFLEKKSEVNYICAISLGGMIAAEWLFSHPKDFEKAILINTSFGDISPFYKRMTLASFSQLVKTPLKKGIARERNILGVVSNRPELYDLTSKIWYEFQLDAPMNPKNAVRQLFAAMKFSTKGRVPNCPTYIIASENDRLAKVSCSHEIAKKWKTSPPVIHPTAGHDLPLDDPDWLSEKITTILKA